MSPREEFGETLRNVGCVVEGEHPVMDGKAHRIKVEGDREGAQSGFYVGHMDGRPAGYAKNNRTGEEIRWKSQGAVLSTQDRAAFKATCERKQAERAAAQLQEQENTAQRVAGQLSSMRENVDTPYLNKKGLGARTGRPPAFRRLMPTGSSGPCSTSRRTGRSGLRRMAARRGASQ